MLIGKELSRQTVALAVPQTASDRLMDFPKRTIRLPGFPSFTLPADKRLPRSFGPFSPLDNAYLDLSETGILPYYKIRWFFIKSASFRCLENQSQTA